MAGMQARLAWCMVRGGTPIGVIVNEPQSLSSQEKLSLSSGQVMVNPIVTPTVMFKLGEVLKQEGWEPCNDPDRITTFYL